VALLFSGNMSTSVQPTMFRKDNGALVVQGQPVFRSGTFRDSMGIQSSWEPLHMQQMLANYEHLKNNSVLKDIPVRDGHPAFLVRGLPGTGKVVGWHTGLSTKILEMPDGQKETFLLADYELTDPAAQASYENGTFRNRSAEVGGYMSNDEAEFWPVYMGFAFVDFSAVEGLNSASGFSYNHGARLVQQVGDQKFTVLMEKEFPVTGTPTSQIANGGIQAPPPPPVQPVQPMAFSVNGVPTSNPAEVQNHILALEAFRSETMESGRFSYVEKLATDGKLMAPQVDGMKAFAKSLTDEQFTAWKAGMDATPASPVLGNHGAQPGQSAPTAPAEAAAQTKIETLRNVVSMHTARGASVEEIKATSSYIQLVALDPTAAL
jgi:hypothetical protein